MTITRADLRKASTMLDTRDALTAVMNKMQAMPDTTQVQLAFADAQGTALGASVQMQAGQAYTLANRLREAVDAQLSSLVQG